MCSLAESEKKLLLEIARGTLLAAVDRQKFHSHFPWTENLRKPAGAFVTLWRGSRLRGCIGQFAGCEALADVVAHCAKLAAFEDPRFPPVRKEELREIAVEISVLSEPEKIAPSDISIGKHGLLITSSTGRGVLLPKVATEFGWGVERFLEETCVKAGLDRHAWRSPEMLIQAFTAEVFTESAANARECSEESYSIST
jgi:AmmeMemoRadiSam system protein A